MRSPGSVKEVVEAGLCIGCGLCEALAPEQWKMGYTPQGRLRPSRTGSGSDDAILQACPGAVARANGEAAPLADAVWGGFHRMQEAWAGDPDTRFRAATGGVLTALAAQLLRSGEARFILHCAASPEAPMRSSWCISETPGQLLERAGSRYGPSDTLAGLRAALDRDVPFAVVAKPCDAGALRELAKSDRRLARNLVAVLAMVCGGASDLGKSQAVLDEYGLSEADVTLFRYRGHGNPGPTRIETRDGRAFEKTYGEMWADESGWRIQTRCKICPDALGEAADIAAADIWPGASPEGEDAGFNGVITRTEAGERLFRAACEAGGLTAGAAITPRQFDSFQPHQVRKKQALLARLRGMAAAGSPVYAHEGLRLEALDSQDAQEEAGTLLRVSGGRFREDLA
ncbi:Coenzyme F420 hydrogenase/dehydrogenase, beta subunit C-terminal domain [Leisingera daeponensis]|uniref:Coenzyme F420 hydrogenase/dehydrogenase, beta subunit C-terminal domain n=1 Tax=Leisingera daeponensis TaxID=405746 RepID=A0ABS7NP71_9RHOB|nr:Coenzyme F420 hydrogenase/dehydrogenase, beta subunit C-terminal domain [Leisingera daeponensis]MBY6141921.1 Coenzyme F420 hydrogenase/dehydrogenase, beta subunit C-terminal domain [Leisingera daeponensis]